MVRHPRHGIAVACAFALVLSNPVRADPAPVVTGRVAVERFAANLRSFPHYTCKYTVTRAEAYSFDDALAGKWVNAVSIDCVLRVDGEYEAWSGRKPPAPPGGPPPAKPGQWGAAGLLHLWDFDYAGNSHIGLTDGKGMSGAWNLLPSDQWFEPVLAPIGAGHGRKQRSVGNPDTLLADPKWEFADEGSVEAAGRRLVRVWLSHTFAHRGGSFNHVERFHLDPTRGYLPTWRSLDVEPNRTLDGRPSEQTYLVEAKDCGSGRWFPMRVLSVRAMISPGIAHQVSELRVTELDLARPPDDEFAVRMPGGSLVVHGSNPRKQFRLAGPQTIHARHLPDLEAELDATLPPPSTWEQLLAPFESWRWPAIGLGAIVLVGALAIVWRWRRKGARPPSPGAVGNDEPTTAGRDA